jgi:Tfp pilus assembly protein PilF
MIQRSYGALLIVALAIAGCGRSLEPERVIVLGLDGVDPDVVDLLITEGKLPHFQRLKHEGAYARLYSQPPLLSPIIWTTIATGKRPADHGIGHFTTVDPTTGNEMPVTSSMRRVKALWNIFSEAGRGVAVVGWWATWPAEPVSGVLVSDHAGYHFLMEQQLAGEGPPAGVVYPESALDRLGRFLRRPEEIGSDEILSFADVEPAELERPFEFGNDLAHFRWALATAYGYRDLGLDLWRSDSPDLLMVYVEGVDTTSHLFGHVHRQQGLAGELAEQQRRYGLTVEKMYVLADEIVGDFLEAMDEHTALVVLSDHGFKLGELPADPSKTRDMRRVSEAYHRDHGILFVYGAGVRPGVRIENASTVDVAPTVLALAGLPAAADMAGRVLAEVLVAPPLPPVPSYERPGETRAEGATRDDGVDAAVLERLESLGYIGSAASTNDRNLATILLREGRYEEAEHAFRQLVGQSPDDPTLHAALATALAGLGRGDEAFAEFDRALQLDPLEVRAYHNRGRLREAMGDVDAAIEDYRRALRYDAEYEPSRKALERLGVGVTGKLPTSPEELQARELLREANELQRRGDLDGAEARVEQALRLTPDIAAVHQFRGNIAKLKGDRKRAIAEFERALELEPDNALFIKNLRSLREGS